MAIDDCLSNEYQNTVIENLQVLEDNDFQILEIDSDCFRNKIRVAYYHRDTGHMLRWSVHKDRIGSEGIRKLELNSVGIQKDYRGEGSNRYDIWNNSKVSSRDRHQRFGCEQGDKIMAATVRWYNNRCERNRQGD